MIGGRGIAMISAATMRERLERRPFVPFRITTSAGTSLDVLHPELMMVGRQTIVVGTTKAPDQKLYDHAVTIGILHIVRLDDLNAPSTPSSNAPASN